jgi:hypothetical protein
LRWRFSPVDESAAWELVRWRYPGAYAQYDLREEAIHTLLDPTNAYFAAHDAQGALVGVCCFGADAQVRGGTYEERRLDVGLGLRPDVSGRGRGNAFAQAVLAFGS